MTKSMNKYKDLIPDDIMKQCCEDTLFQLHDWDDYMQVFTATEQAHWIYIDGYAQNPYYKKAKEMRIKRFMQCLFAKFSKFKEFHENFDYYYNQWNDVRISTPSFGAALIDMNCEKVLLVKEINKAETWGFPKGKINYRGESQRECAIREVFEETGFDITHKVDENLYMERNIPIFHKGKYVNKLVGIYVIFGVPEKRWFRPETENEIVELGWFNLENMLTPSCPLAGSDIFFARPFLEDLKKIVRPRRKRVAKAKPKVIQPKNNKPRTKSKTENKNIIDQDFKMFLDQIRTDNRGNVERFFENAAQVPLTPPGLPPRAVKQSKTAKRKLRKRINALRNQSENQRDGGNEESQQPFQIEGQLLQMETPNQQIDLGDEENATGEDSGIWMAVGSPPNDNVEELTKELKKCLKMDTNNRIPLQGIQNTMKK